MHLDVGQQVWLVTAAPVEVAGIIAARMGLTGALGTTAEHVDGVYTGRLKGDLLHGPAKAEAVRALAHEHGFDLARCFAYSDSYNDLPMLSLVGHPVRDQPGRPAAGPRGGAGLADPGLPHRPQGGPARAARRGGAGAAAGAVATGLAVRRRLRGEDTGTETEIAHSIAADREIGGGSGAERRSRARFPFRRSATEAARDPGSRSDRQDQPRSCGAPPSHQPEPAAT